MPGKAKEKAEKYLEVGHSPAENHARSQQKLYDEKVERDPSVTRVISEFFKTNLIGFGYHYLRSRFGRRHPYQAYPRFGDTGIYQLQAAKPSSEEISIALLSDWGSDTEESDKVGYLVADHAPDYTIHLGDIYFVGTPKEIEENFTAPYASWYYGESGSLALAGNHEMYSNGNAFFQHLLPAMYAKEGEIRKTQQAGFFCLETQHWRIIGLDTGYTSVGRPFLEIISPPDCHLRKEQIDWLRDIVKVSDPNDKRGLVFLSHHPYFSAFRDEYPKTGEQLFGLLEGTNKPIVWFWGHDHRLIAYQLDEKTYKPGVYGRCIGHGGMPVETTLPEKQSDTDKILFYDQRIRQQIGRFKVGYNGFVTLQIAEDRLTATYTDLEDTKVLEEEWVVDKNGQLNWNVRHALPELTVRP